MKPQPHRPVFHVRAVEQPSPRSTAPVQSLASDARREKHQRSKFQQEYVELCRIPSALQPDELMAQKRNRSHQLLKQPPEGRRLHL